MEIKFGKPARQDCFLHSVALALCTGSAGSGIHRYGQGPGTCLLLCMFEPAETPRPATSYTFHNLPTNEGLS